MIIPITIPPSRLSNKPTLPPTLAKIGHDEVVLIELQGTLQVDCTHENERDGQLIGKLKIDESGDKPTLMIGHHLLEGKVASLPKPLAVLQRHGQEPHSDGDHDAEMDENPDSTVKPGWDVIAIVKRKIIFSKRPMPVVGSSMGAK